MVSADNKDYLFGYYIWLLAHPELRGILFDSEFDFNIFDIHAVNRYTGLDGNYNYLEYCEICMSRGGDIINHHQLWNFLMVNIKSLESIYFEEFRCLMKKMHEDYTTATDEDDDSSARYAIIERYEFLLSLNIQFIPISDETEYNRISSFVSNSSRTIDEAVNRLYIQSGRNTRRH